VDVSRSETDRGIDASRRVWVVGVSGSGKSHAAARLAERLGVEPAGIDRMQWRDGWAKAPPEEIQAAIRRVVERDAWVFEGNLVEPAWIDLVAGRAEAVVWLDFPFGLALRRLAARSLGRARSRQTLWGTDNRERLRRVFLSRDSPIVWMARTFRVRRRAYAALAAGPLGGRVRRFRRPRELDAWVSAPGRAG
jgi:adenylate kinase family enzyme